MLFIPVAAGHIHVRQQGLQLRRKGSQRMRLVFFNSLYLRCAARIVPSALILCAAMSRLTAQQAPASPQPVMPALPATYAQPYRQKKQTLSFAQAASLLNKTAGLSIVADGQPVLPQAALRFEGTLHQAVDQIAEAFDFSWTPTKSGVILMRKRFQADGERPQISLVEARQIAKDMIKALRSVPYDAARGTWSEQLQQLTHSFSPQQWQSLQTGERTSVAMLTPLQMDALTQVVLRNTFTDQMLPWERLLDELALLPDTYLQTQIRGGDPLDAAVPRYYDVMRVARGKDGSLMKHTFVTVPAPKGGEAKQ